MQLGYRSAGDGGLPVLLLHGLAGSADDFDARLGDLAARDLHPVALDLRGHGASSKPADEAAYAMPALATDVLEAADELGWDRFAVVGHELGGVVAQEVALQAPERIDALVLQSTAPGPLPLRRDLAVGGVELVRGAGTMAPLVRVHRELGADAVDAMEACAPAAYASLLTQLLDCPDRSLLLAELPVPTLILAGERDGAFVDAAHDLAAVLPSPTLGVLPDVGHCPHRDAPREWLAFVWGFLQASRV